MSSASRKSQKSNSDSRSNDGDSSKVDGKLLDALKHYDSFYEKPPPGLLKEDDDEERPEDCIPDTPQNRDAREFLSKAPSKGLWMPLGKEVKVMKCWRCKNYGHRTGDKECPMFMSGNRDAEEFRHSHEDPMYNYVKESEIEQKKLKVEMLKQLLNTNKSKKKSKKKQKDKSKKRKKEKQNKKRKHSRDESSDSSSDSDSSLSSSSSSSSTSSSGTSNDSGDSHHRKRKRHYSSSKKSSKHKKSYKSKKNKRLKK